MRRHTLPTWLVVAVALLGAAASAHAQVNPATHWKQLDSKHFRVIYEAGLDSLAQHAAARAELEHHRLSAGLVKPPKHKIDLIIGDNTDITNGYATPFPDNRVYLFVRPPVDDLALQYYDDWLNLVVTHELTHIFHMEQSGRVGRLLRTVFGRVPFSWPFFPILDMPRWNLEGLATLIESQHTGVGRVEGSYHEMVVRTAVLEQHFPTIDRVSGETPIWPGGNRAYIYGSLFMDYIARRYGEAAHTELIKRTAGSLLPASWRMDAIARKSVGKSYSKLYRDWQAELDSTYGQLATSLRSQGLTEPERITPSGRYAWYPRLAPDNRTLAYADENARDVTATRLIDLQTRADERIRRNGFGPVTWLPDGSGYITAQFELKNAYEIYSDLYIVKHGVEERLTHGERAETPDLSRDGRTLVYVQNLRGTNRLMLRDMATGVSKVLVEASPDVQWTLPRWNADGSRIAVQRWTRANGHEIAIVDRTGMVTGWLRTEGVTAAPAWSADGRYILFSSDESGITNLYATDGNGLRQVTNVLGGAFFPEVSRDGRWIYYSGYHYDGFHIERIPYNPLAWRSPARVSKPAALRPDSIRPVPGQSDSMQVMKSHGYHALGSALPRFWIPLAYGDTALATFVGVATTGTDAIGRHTYYASLAVDPEHGRTAGELTYNYAGLGNPVLSLGATRNWDYTGHVAVRVPNTDSILHFKAYEREDRITLAATLRHPRWRESSAFVLGVEGVEFNRGLIDTGRFHFRDPQDKLFGLLAGVAFGNYRVPAYAISREDGVGMSTFVRRRFDLDPSQSSDGSYTEYSGSGAAFKSIDGFGFAHQVVALRGSGLVRTGGGVGPTDVGGATDFLPVRGYVGSARIGFKAWSAAMEYRMPVALIARGWHLRPAFVDRLALSGFFDAGNASCNAAQRALYVSCAGAAGRSTRPLLSTGLELNVSGSLFTFVPVWLRAGVAQQLSDGKQLQAYAAFGQAF